MEIVILGYDVW